MLEIEHQFMRRCPRFLWLEFVTNHQALVGCSKLCDRIEWES